MNQPKLFLSICLSLLMLNWAEAQNQAPSISITQVSVDFTNHEMTVQYSLTDFEGDNAEVTFSVSSDGGQNYGAISTSLSGDVGYPVSPGSRCLTWDFPDSLTDIATYKVKLLADDRMPIDLQTLVDQVDSQRLRQDLVFIQGVRNFSNGSAHLEDVKDTIQSRLEELGLPTHRQPFIYSFYTAHNIIGHQAGEVDANTTYIADAHFDGVAAGPGADDNGSGVVGFLEAARILSKYHFKYSIDYIGFDLEEAGLLGSHRYVTNGIPPDMDVQGVFNFEMIGYYSNEANSQSLPAGFNQLFPAQYNAIQADSFRGNFITNVANTNSISLQQTYDSCAAAYVPSLKTLSVAVGGNGQIAPDLRRSDHASFWDGGYEALMLTDGANFRNSAYHTAYDTLGRLNFTFMSDVVKATVASLAKLAKIIHGTTDTSSVNSVTGIESLQSVCDFKVWSSLDQKSIRIIPGTCYSGMINVRLVNLGGKVVFSNDFNTTGRPIELNTTQLLPGIYLTVLNDGKSIPATKKVLVQ